MNCEGIQSKLLAERELTYERALAIAQGSEKDSLGMFVGRKAKIEVDPSAQLRYCKARTLPYAMRPRVEEELERLVTEGIREPVAHSEWATLMWPLSRVTRRPSVSVGISA